MYAIDFPSEKAIEDYVFAKIQEENICPLSGDEVYLAFRQWDISGYGIADLVKVQVEPEEVIVTIVELKNETLKEAHLGQLSRYMVGLNRQLHRYRRRLPKPWKIRVRGELAGPFESGKNDLVFLLENIENIDVFRLSMSMDEGFCCKPLTRGWHRTDENLKGGKGLVRESWEIFSDLYGAMVRLGEIGEEHGESA